MEVTGADSAHTAEAEPPAPARAGGDELGDSAPQRFKVEFTATEEYVRLVQEARALLSHRAPRLTLEEVYLRAMRAFVETLRKQKYGSKESAGATTDDAIVADGRGMAASGELELPRGVHNETRPPRSRRPRSAPLRLRRRVRQALRRNAASRVSPHRAVRRLPLARGRESHLTVPGPQRVGGRAGLRSRRDRGHQERRSARLFQQARSMNAVDPLDEWRRTRLRVVTGRRGAARTTTHARR